MNWKRLRPVAAALAMLGTGATAHAFNIDVGNEDIEMRWDNTIRYNAGVRVQDRNPLIANTPNADEGTFSRDKGELTTNRFDLLSEFDFVWKKQMGFRVSAAAWYDGNYGDDSHSNPKFAPYPNYTNGKYTNFTKRFYEGPSGEILDAFVFANFDLGEVSSKVRAGRTAVVWGEALFLGGALNSISYSQVPLDLQKGFATPGVEAKELFRPLNQLYGQFQVTDTLSLAGQYFLEWEAYRYPEGGTYLGPVDFAFNGPDGFTALKLGNTLIGARNGGEVAPNQSGEFGLSARWTPEALDGTLGFYYRRYSDKLPQALTSQFTALGSNPIYNGSQYNLYYGENIDLLGLSFAKNIAGISFGSELSYRHNTPLLSKILGNPAGVLQGKQPTLNDNTPGPRGDTMHGLVNAVGIISDTPLFDTATWAAELVWSHWLSVDSGKETFNAEGYAGCTFNKNQGSANTPGNKWDGCATKNYVGLGAAFTPTWFQVYPGVDLQLPITYAVGLSGNAPTIFGGNQGNGNYSVGLGFDIFQKHRVDLKYISYFGQLNDYGTNQFGQQLITQNGFTTLLKDRDFISLTLKTTF